MAPSYGVVALAARAWEACDVGVNAGANALTLLLVLLPALVLANGVAGALAAGAIRRWTRAGGAAQVAAVAGAIALVSYVAIALVATPGGARCPDGAPPWWPGWLP